LEPQPAARTATAATASPVRSFVPIPPPAFHYE
jgi:hypothetical protein